MLNQHVWLFLICFCLDNARENVVYGIQNETFVAGTDVTLECVGSASEFETYIWTDEENSETRLFVVNENVVKTDTAKEIRKYDNFHIKNYYPTSVGMLIESIFLDDRGTYRCELVIESHIIAKYLVDVEATPLFVKMLCEDNSVCPNPVNDNPRSKFYCTCEAVGAYPATLKFLWDGIDGSSTNVSATSLGPNGTFDFISQAIFLPSANKTNISCSLSGFKNEISSNQTMGSYRVSPPNCSLVVLPNKECTFASLLCSCTDAIPDVKQYTFYNESMAVILYMNNSNVVHNIPIQNHASSTFYCGACNGIHFGEESLASVIFTCSMHTTTIDTTFFQDVQTSYTTNPRPTSTVITNGPVYCNSVAWIVLTWAEAFIIIGLLAFLLIRKGLNKQRRKSGSTEEIGLDAVSGEVSGYSWELTEQRDGSKPVENRVEYEKNISKCAQESIERSPSGFLGEQIPYARHIPSSQSVKIYDAEGEHAYAEIKDTAIERRIEGLQIFERDVVLSREMSSTGLMSYRLGIISSSGKQVVKKRLPDIASPELCVILAQEIKITSSLAFNDNVVKVLGWMTDPPYIIYKYVAGKNLLEHIRSCQHDIAPVKKQANTQLTTENVIRQMMNMSFQVACGMSFLLKNKCIHPGLRASKVIVNPSGKCKLYDFLSEDHADDLLHIFWKQNEPVEWMPPEYFQSGRVTPAGDVWSFGVLLWEIFSYGLEPYKNKDKSLVRAHILNDRLLSKPRDCPTLTWQIVESCWKYSPGERPNFDKISEDTSMILANHEGCYGLGQYNIENAADNLQFNC